MRKFVCALLLVVPLVMAGMPPDMEDMFRQMMKDSDGGHSSGGDSSGSSSSGWHSYGGDSYGSDSSSEDKDGHMSGGMSGDIDGMLKMMMEGKWDMDKGGKGSREDSDERKDKEDDWGADKGWYDKGWHDKGWPDKGWYDSGSDEDDSKSEDSDSDSVDKEEYEKWLKWMKEMKEEKKHDKEDEEMKKKIMAFKAYQKMKKEKEHEMEEKKMALYKQMKMIQEKKKMSEKLYEVSMDFMKRKRSFTFDVLSRFLGFCDCHDSLDLFKRIAAGRFGYDDDDDDNGDDRGGMGDDKMPGGNGNDDSGYDDDDDKGEMGGFHKPSEGEMREIVMKFLYMSHEERLKHVLHDVVKVMCGGAKQFFAHMKQVEHYLIEYRKHYHGN